MTTNMISTNTAGRIVGALFLTVMISYSIGAFLLVDPILNSPDYLTQISTHRSDVLLGVCLELINGVAYICIAILVYPILKSLNESLALGYVVFRILEFALQIVSDLSPMLLISLSQNYSEVASADSSYYQTIGTALIALRYWANQLVFINYAMGAIIFYFLLSKTKLVPRLLSIWGLVGAPLVIINVLLDIFAFNQIEILGLVMGLNEIALGFWLLIKGFNVDAELTARQNK